MRRVRPTESAPRGGGGGLFRKERVNRSQGTPTAGDTGVLGTRLRRLWLVPGSRPPLRVWAAGAVGALSTGNHRKWAHRQLLPGPEWAQLGCPRTVFSHTQCTALPVKLVPEPTGGAAVADGTGPPQNGGFSVCGACLCLLNHWQVRPVDPRHVCLLRDLRTLSRERTSVRGTGASGAVQPRCTSIRTHVPGALGRTCGGGGGQGAPGSGKLGEATGTALLNTDTAVMSDGSSELSSRSHVPEPLGHGTLRGSLRES